jgi:response regulator of citrate/malate metabolism
VIRTLVVDDDFMAVSVHREFLERISGFEVVGEATTGREARTLVEKLHPDLVLLDIYLPDENGIELMRRLRASDSRVDVIAITSAKDVDVLRDAMQLGVVHYIVKPFTFTTFRDRLETYATARQRLADMKHAEQRDIDRLYGLLRTSSDASLPKGISSPTLTLVASLLRGTGDAISAGEVASRAGLSQGVARRYLRFLTDSGAVEFTLRYGATGRPEHLYRWAA